MNNFWRELLCAMLVGTAIGGVIKAWDYDATDQPEAENVVDRRSGMTLYTDYGTGCQYLQAGLGGLTPRLDKEGNHVCDTE